MTAKEVAELPVATTGATSVISAQGSPMRGAYTER